MRCRLLYTSMCADADNAQSVPCHQIEACWGSPICLLCVWCRTATARLGLQELVPEPPCRCSFFMTTVCMRITPYLGHLACPRLLGGEGEGCFRVNRSSQLCLTGCLTSLLLLLLLSCLLPARRVVKTLISNWCA
jgi:hypothetical protein